MGQITNLYYDEDETTIYTGDCVERMQEIPDNSVDAIVTDPPYGLEFMGKEWDKCTRNLMNPTSEADIKRKKKYGKNYSGRLSNLPDLSKNKPKQQQEWHYQWAKECLRVLKPGGYLLAFGGTRTYHRMAVAVEDAGFEVRDMIEWVYGSGFPKSHDIGKAVDKLQGNEREVIGKGGCRYPVSISKKGVEEGYRRNLTNATTETIITKGTSEYEGWGTALKPAHEPICVARKPLSEKTVAANCLKWGTGGLNVDGCRVDTKPQGRFPANLIHDGSEGVEACFPDAKTSRALGYNWAESNNNNPVRIAKNIKSGVHFAGSASLYFKSIIYQAKPSKKERGKTNNHPTVKPVALMEYLITMVSRKGGTILDPFMGSGTTLMAARKLGRQAVGIELSEEYCEIAVERIKNISSQGRLF